MGAGSRRRQPKIYATVRRHFSMEQLRRMGFQQSSEHGMVKMGMCRIVLAVASTADNRLWRVTPMVRQWK